MVRAIIGLLALVSLLTACGGPSEEEAQAAIDVALNRIGDCLNIAGYDVNPDHQADNVIAGTEGRVGLMFHSEQGAEPIHVEIDMDTQTVHPFSDEDVQRLTSAGC